MLIKDLIKQLQSLNLDNYEIVILTPLYNHPKCWNVWEPQVGTYTMFSAPVISVTALGRYHET